MAADTVADLPCHPAEEPRCRSRTTSPVMRIATRSIPVPVNRSKAAPILIQARLALALGQRKDAIKALEKARKWAQPAMQARYDTKLALLKGQTAS